jgi:hypothetical protein
MIENQNKSVEWVHCNQCLRKTRHEIIAFRTLEETEELDDNFVVDWSTTYTMLECRGCGAVVLRRRVVSHDMHVDDTDFYPPPISRQSPGWLYDLPNEIRDLLKETYVALQAGSKRLAIMGARSLVDLFMTATLGDIGGFQQKLEQLVEKGFLSKQNKGVLETALETGHAVIHRGHSPKADDVNLVFDIVENLLQTMVLTRKSEELKKHTPKRKSNN